MEPQQLHKCMVMAKPALRSRVAMGIYKLSGGIVRGKPYGGDGHLAHYSDERTSSESSQAFELVYLFNCSEKCQGRMVVERGFQDVFRSRVTG